MSTRGSIGTVVLLTLVCVWTSSCSGDRAGCATPLGPAVMDTVDLAVMAPQLEVVDRVEVHWWPEATSSYAVVHAWEGTRNGVRVDDNADVLRIEEVNRCAWVRRLDAVPRVDLHGIRPSTIQLEAQADFVMEAPWQGDFLSVGSDEMAGDVDLWFEGDSLRVRLPNGIGHARLRGTATRLTCFRSGFGDLDATGLAANQVMVHHAGLGDVRLRPQGYLFLELAGAGNAILEGAGNERDIRILPGATGEVFTVP